MPQLDGLRCIAVALVMFNHFIPADWSLYHLFPFGTAGVHLFYVLSGYLITSILLQARDHKSSNKQALSAFFMRRILRIFPIYYLTVLTLFFFDIGPSQEKIWWNITYTSNFMFALEGRFLQPLNHFWSLAVEEQFYLLWPWVVLFLPRKKLLPLVYCLILVSPLYRMLSYFMGWGKVASLVLLPGCFDLLGFGALLAIKNDTPLASRTSMRIGLVTFIGLQLYYILSAGTPHILLDAFRFTSLGLVWLWLVSEGAKGFRNLPGRILSHKIPVYLGKISYGLYMYNHILPYLLGPSIAALGYSMAIEVSLRFIVFTSISIVLAALSWKFIEAPIIGLKKRYPYYS